MKRNNNSPRFELCGAAPESVLNACAVSGIFLWDVESIDPYTLRFCASSGDRALIEAICKRCMCELRVLSTGIKSRGRESAKRRKRLIVLLLLAAALLLASSLFVWDVEVEGEETLSEGEVLRALEDCGLYEGCFRHSLSSDRLRSLVIERLPKIAWLSVSISGSRARVSISERLEKPQIYNENEPVNIVAAKTGIIDKMYVFNGEAAVRSGQAVTEGEMLVSGRPVSLAGSRSLRARAQIWADTRYELYAVSPHCPGKSPRGPGSLRLALKIGKNRINFYISSGKGVDGCDKIISEYKIGVEGLFTLPVTLVAERLLPYRQEPCTEQSPAETEQRLYAELMSRMTEGEVIRHRFVPGRMEGASALTLYAQCYENIAREQPVQEG